MTEAGGVSMDSTGAFALGNQVIYIVLDVGLALRNASAGTVTDPPPLVRDVNSVMSTAIFDVICSDCAVALEGGLGNGAVCDHLFVYTGAFV